MREPVQLLTAAQRAELDAISARLQALHDSLGDNEFPMTVANVANFGGVLAMLRHAMGTLVVVDTYDARGD